MDDQSILLETGTNELSIMELYIGGQSFGINTLKIREVLTYDSEKLTHTPDSTESLIGMYYYRGKAIPVIDMAIELKKMAKRGDSRVILVVAEFNQILIGFIFDEVNRIYRLSWKEIKQPPKLIEVYKTKITGIASINKNEVLILDLESIVANIFPKTALTADGIITQDIQRAKRAKKNLMIVEDSALIRKTILDILIKSGYRNILSFNNGEDAYQQIYAWLKEGNESIKKHVELIISDIEMPQMDGLTLSRIVKKDMNLPITLIIFSSLINEQIAVKCREVGADSYISKPQMGELVALVDKYLLENED
ncbi:chemotaxis protein CheV [bacterium]|nr:chemotaxis protein CheV [bacterium]